MFVFPVVPRFSRDALTGFDITTRTLDGRALRIPVTDVVSPHSVKVVSGEGMPVSKAPGRKGDLRVKFDVQFPATLSKEKKAELRRVL